MGKLYKDSRVELTRFTAAHYDSIMNLMSLGYYAHFIKKAVSLMQIQPEDKILDLGCDAGRNAYLMTSYLSGKGRLLGFDKAFISFVIHRLPHEVRGKNHSKCHWSSQAGGQVFHY